MNRRALYLTLLVVIILTSGIFIAIELNSLRSENSSSVTNSTSTSNVSTSASSSSTTATPTTSSVSIVSSPSSTSSKGAFLGIQHVIVIAMENQEYSSIANCTCAPYENALIKNYSYAANYFSLEHPSLPNYLDLTAGSDLGITSDCTPPFSCPVTNTTNLSDLLSRKGLSWKNYAESMPSPCYLQNSGEYVTKHTPFTYYPDVTGNDTYCEAHIVPMNVTTGEGLIDDLNSNRLPNYSFVSPNLCDDGHDACAPLNNKIGQADAWLSNLVPKIILSPEFGSTVVFIAYDEGISSTTQSRVYCVIVSPFAKSDYLSYDMYTHFSLLATVEAIFNLGNLGRNDSSATVMSDMFS